jgi:hypothetical protein
MDEVMAKSRPQGGAIRWARELLARYASKFGAYWRDAISLADLLQLARVHLALSKVGNATFELIETDLKPDWGFEVGFLKRVS